MPNWSLSAVEVQHLTRLIDNEIPCQARNDKVCIEPKSINRLTNYDTLIPFS